MEFGIVDQMELDKIDFTLPAEPSNNQIILPGQPAADSRVYIGLPRWGRVEWVGKLYPLRVKEPEFLQYYAAHFNMIELNATHYTYYGAQRIRNWEHKVGKDFKFCVKMHKDITHAGLLYAKDLELEKFIEPVRHFGDKLGNIFIQLSEKFGYKRKGDLFNFIDMLPRDLPFFLEIRHPEWFVPEKLQELRETLEKYKVGLIITDTAGRRDCAHMHLTVPKVFVRFVTNTLHPTDYDRVDQWAERIKLWLDKGIEDVYFAIHMEDEIHSLDIVKYVVDKFNEVCSINYPTINLIK